MKTKILHSITSGAFGGLEIYVTNLIKLHSQNVDYEVHVLLIEDSLIHNELKQSNVKIHFLHSRKKVNFKDLIQLTGIIKRHKIDIVHSHTNKDLPRVSIVKLFTSIKHIFSLYMFPVLGKNNIVHRFLYSQVDLFITTSLVTNDFVKAHYPIDGRKVMQLPYGRSLEQYVQSDAERTKFRSRIGANDATLVFGTMCRIDKSKGVMELAQAFNLLNNDSKTNVKIVIIGDPTITGKDAEGKILYENDALETENWITAYIKENDLGENVIRLPFQKEFIQWLDAFDVFVLASYQEMYSLAVIDAMLMSKPVVGTKSGGTVEQVKDGERGVLVAPESAESLAKAIEFYIKQPELIKQHGNNAHIWALNSHSMDNMLLRLDSFYKSALA